MNQIKSKNITKIFDIGSLDVNGSLRTNVPVNCDYVGVDFKEGKGVDVVLDDPYKFPFENEIADIVISSSCFEHSEMFWLVFLEIMRILKPRGLFYLNVPSNGHFHSYPVDCWRFYPDSGKALVNWAKRNSLRPALLESYISSQDSGIWNDFISVFLKDEKFTSTYPNRILDNKKDIFNGTIHNKKDYINKTELSEDQRKLKIISNIISNKIKIT